MKRIAILYLTNTPIIDAIKYQLNDCEIDCYEQIFDIQKDYDLKIVLNNSIANLNNTLSCHHSLLPSFNCDEPEREAMLCGVKVSGITFLYNNQIIAQYPIFITSDMHYEDLKQKLDYLEQMLLPLIVKKVLNKEPFEIKDLLGSSSCCSGGCSGCSH